MIYLGNKKVKKILLFLFGFSIVLPHQNMNGLVVSENTAKVGPWIGGIVGAVASYFCAKLYIETNVKYKSWTNKKKHLTCLAVAAVGGGVSALSLHYFLESFIPTPIDWLEYGKKILENVEADPLMRIGKTGKYKYDSEVKKLSYSGANHYCWLSKAEDSVCRLKRDLEMARSHLKKVSEFDTLELTKKITDLEKTLEAMKTHFLSHKDYDRQREKMEEDREKRGKTALEEIDRREDLYIKWRTAVAEDEKARAARDRTNVERQKAKIERKRLDLEKQRLDLEQKRLKLEESKPNA